MANHPMDDRRSWTGSTLVISDRYGPREFWRAGQQVNCVCDPERGTVCAYHGRQREQVAASDSKPRKRRRRRPS